MLRATVITLGILIILFSAAWCQSSGSHDFLSDSERQWLAEREKPVTIGVTAIPPQVIVNETDDAYEGISIDVIKLLEQRLDYHFQLVPFPTWKELIEKAAAREVDVVFAAQMTPERQEYLLFTEPYLEMINQIVVRNDVVGTLGVNDLVGLRVAISDGSALHEHFRIEHSSVELNPVENEAMALLAVSFGEADAAVVETARASYYIQEHGITNLRVAGNAHYPYELRFASRSDEPLLNQILEKGLGSISAAEREAIYNRWVSFGAELFDLGQFWRSVGTGLGAVFVVLAAVLLWVRTLRKRVEIRTQELKQEFVERTRAEQALTASEHRYRQLVEAMNEGFGIVDADGIITYMNQKAASMLGYRTSEMVGQDIKRFFDEPNRAIFIEQVTQRRAGIAESYEIEWAKKDGSKLPTIVSPKPLSDEDGSYRGSFAVITDISRQKKAETALRESEQRLALHAQFTPLGVMEWNLDFEITEWNQAAERIFGFSRKEVRGRNGVGLIFSESDGPRIHQIFGELLVHKGGERATSKCHTRSGVIIDCNWHNTVLVDENGIVIGVASLVEDVTQRTHVQADIKAERDKAQTYLDIAGVVLVALDQHGKITLLNRKGCELLGYASDDLIGKDWFSTAVPADVADAVRAAFDQIMEGKLEPVEYYENPVVTSTGKIRTIAWHNTVIQDESGRITGTLSSGEDITERRKAEEALRESERRNKAWIENSPVCTKFVDLDLNLQFMSVSGIRELKLDDINELYGKPYPFHFYPDSFKIPMSKNLKKAKETGETITQEASVVDIEGNELWYHSTIVPVNDDQDNLDYLMVVSLETTDRKRAEMEREKLISELETKTHEMERFTYTVSHDLKSPLVTIGGFLDILRRDAVAGDIKQIDVDIDRIAAAASRMHELLDDLLEMSRIGRLDNPPEDVSLTDLADQAVDLVSGRFPEGGIDIDISREMPIVNGDRSRLLDVMQNLIENSVKYMGEQDRPTIEIGCRRDGPEVVCYVKDNGMGIDPRYHDRVFDVFEQLEPQSEGTGIGLALVKRIVETHNGRIWVESNGIGKGATFCFVLPSNDRSLMSEEA